jgi:hypothetical protein
MVLFWAYIVILLALVWNGNILLPSDKLPDNINQYVMSESKYALYSAYSFFFTS